MNKRTILDILFSLVILSLVLVGCFSPELIPDPEVFTPRPTAAGVGANRGPRLRVENMGTNDIHELTVVFPDSKIYFGDVPAGATTAYLSAPKGVYNYAAYTFLQDGHLLEQPVVDWVGESPRAGNSFTYVIDYDPARGNMQWIRLITVHDQ